jgi:hypothetical protein
MVCNSHVVSVMTGQQCQMQHTAVVVGSAGTIRLSGAAGFGGAEAQNTQVFRACGYVVVQGSQDPGAFPAAAAVSVKQTTHCKGLW